MMKTKRCIITMLTFVWCMCAFPQYIYIPDPYRDDEYDLNYKRIPEGDDEVSQITRKPEKREDSNVRFNDLYGEVSIRPNWDEDDAYEFAELETIIYNNDRIRTKEESGAILGLEDMSTFVMRENTILIVYSKEEKVSKIQILWGRIKGNVKKMMKGESFGFEMTQCVAGIKGTIFELEELGTESHAWLFTGKMEITSKRTGEVYTMLPGDSVSVSQDGEIRVGEFDIETKAKEFGISMDDINAQNKSGVSSTSASEVLDVINVIAWISTGLLFIIMLILFLRVVNRNKMGCGGCLGLVVLLMFLSSLTTAIVITACKDFVSRMIEGFSDSTSNTDSFSGLRADGEDIDKQASLFNGEGLLQGEGFADLSNMSPEDLKEYERVLEERMRKSK